MIIAIGSWVSLIREFCLLSWQSEKMIIEESEGRMLGASGLIIS